MIGEIGGSAEEDAAQFLKTRPKRRPEARRRLHRRPHGAPRGAGWAMPGLIISGGKGGAEDKIAAMEAARNPAFRLSPARLGKTLVELLKG